MSAVTLLPPAARDRRLPDAAPDAPRSIPPRSRPEVGIIPNLEGVSETMLWALHNRAIEASRPGGLLVDPDAVRIHAAIDYDFDGQFGQPAGSLAQRAVEIDRVIRGWLDEHPQGIIVSLGEGLETQCHRVDNGSMRWLSVDLPVAIRLRERFLTPCERFRHIAHSVLDPAWMAEIDAAAEVFFVAQGLLMYLDPDPVRQILSGIASRFPGAEIVFDVVPRWFSQMTMLGLNQTPNYRLPPMPWGINRDEIAETLGRWHPGLGRISFLEYGFPRGLPLFLAEIAPYYYPLLQGESPSLVHILPANEHKRRLAPAAPIPAAEGVTALAAAATRSADLVDDIVRATGQVIAKRMALWFAASFNPQLADPAEFTLMIAEKIEAFSTAGALLLQHAGRGRGILARRMAEGILADAARPLAEILAGQVWLERMAMTTNMLGLLGFDAQEAALTPIWQTVTANAKRLNPNQ